MDDIYEDCHWHTYQMIHWNIEDLESQIYRHDNYDSFSLEYCGDIIPDSFLFSVRCRYRILNSKGLPLFSSLLEVEFYLRTHECTIEMLMQYNREARLLYAEEYEREAVGTVLEDLPLQFDDLETNRETLISLLEKYSLL